MLPNAWQKVLVSFWGSGGRGVFPRRCSAIVKCPQAFAMRTIWPCMRVKSAAAKYSRGFDMRAMSLCVGIVPETCVTVVQ